MNGIVKRNAAVLTLIDFYENHAQVGEVISYDRLEEICGEDIRSEGGRAIISRVKKALLNLGLVLANVRTQGYRLLPNNEISGASADQRQRGLRAIKRASRIISAIDLRDLSEDQRQQAIQEIYKNSLLITSAKKGEREKKIVGSYDPEKLLDVFRSV